MTRDQIVVGLDASPSARAALRWAAGYARDTGARLRAVHVLDWPVGDPAHRVHAVNGLVSLPQHGTDSAFAGIMQRELQQVDPPEDWVVQFAEGDIGPELIKQSAEATLLVVGTRQHVGLERILVGSISHYCLSHAACPVVAVPALAVGDDGGGKGPTPRGPSAQATR